MAQDERKVIAANEAKSRELKIKLDALSVFEQARLSCLLWLFRCLKTPLSRT